MFSVTSYVPLLQAEYRSFVELDSCVGPMPLYCSTKKQSSLFLLCLFCKLKRVQNYAARIVTGNFDYLNFRSADLLYELNWA